MKEIEIYSASSSEYFSFNLDENTPLSVLADEVSSMLRQKEQYSGKGSSQGMIFYSTERGEILDSKKTLNELGISTGAVLCIV